MTEIMLRPDQLQAKREIYARIRQGQSRVALQAMTSFGKTVLAASIVHDAMEKGLGVLFCAPMITLIDQTLVEFDRFGISDCGVIQADHPLTDYSRPIQICSVQSIASILKRDRAGWERFQQDRLIIIDECHIWHKPYEVMLEVANKPVIGLSATPWRKGLSDWFDSLVQGPSTTWLIENGNLSPFRAFSHYVPDMTGVATNASGDYSLKESGEKYQAKIIGDIVGTWRKHAEGRKTILFAPRVADAQRFAAEFVAQGYKAVAISGYMDKLDCQMEVEKFRKGETQIICSVSKLATGFSVTDVGCIIDAQPTKSLMRHIQKLGRGLRVHPGKDDVIILDNAGNLIRNGLPDDEYPAELVDGSGESKDRRKPDDPKPEPCPQCHAVKPPKVRKCPACGFAPVAKSKVEVEDGNLVELGKIQRKENKNWTANQKRRFFGELKTIAADRGYKPGWAANQYRQRFGVWPNAYKDAPPVEPSFETRDWVTSRLIAYHKRTEKRNAAL